MTKAEQEAALRATRDAERANPEVARLAREARRKKEIGGLIGAGALFMGAAVASHGAYQVIGFIVGIPITLVLLLGFFGWLRNL